MATATEAPATPPAIAALPEDVQRAMDKAAMAAVLAALERLRRAEEAAMAAEDAA